tara:strand:+ start:4096 stop:5034 length:939 start_codon:yes stop_codon:yes gene_type:complete
MTSQLQIYSFYRFKKINNKKKLKIDLLKFINKKKIRGTILIAHEGINGSISGKSIELNEIIKIIKKTVKIRNLSLKINNIDYLPFNRIKIRLKKEIVSFGMGNLNINERKSKYIHPSEWNDLINSTNIKLIDTRNLYEINIGRFKKSINPMTSTFREFPKKFDELKIKKDDRIAMYCTGGIRCEKASLYLSSIGYKKIYQLDGGILNYLSYCKENLKENLWQGECFVFDNRVSVNRKLGPGKFIQCHGCRRPITFKDTKTKEYKKGVCCPYCFNERSNEQKIRSNVRQKQIDNANMHGLSHSFKKINQKEFE